MKAVITMIQLRVLHRIPRPSKWIPLLLMGMMAMLLLGPIASVGCTNRENNGIVESFVPADDYHSNHNFVVGILGSQYVSWNVQQGDGVYGDFQVTNPSSGGDQAIDFFICDSSNYALWSSGQQASVYQLQQDVASYSFHFRIPYDDTWYFVFQNHAWLTSKTINFDLYMDQTPPSINMNLDAGATYSGIKEITATISEAQFSISSVSLYIDGNLVHSESDSSFSYSWNTATYSNGAHTIRMVAKDNVGNSGYEDITVTVYNAAAATSSQTTGSGNNGGGTTSSDTMPPVLPMAFGLIMLIAVVGIVGLSRGRGKASSAASYGSGGTGPGSPTVKEREVVSERFMVICPFCGSKNEQGTSKCQVCGARL